MHNYLMLFHLYFSCMRNTPVQWKHTVLCSVCQVIQVNLQYKMWIISQKKQKIQKLHLKGRHNYTKYILTCNV